MIKLCKVCGVEKPTHNFSKNSSTKDNLQNMCKECNKAYLVKWNKENPEKAKYSRRNTNVEHTKEYNRLYMQENKENQREYIKLWVENNREKKNAYTRKRRDANDMSYDEIEEMFYLYGNKCFNCEATTKRTLDHTMPFSSGYKLSVNNCTVLCQSCNSSKHTKHQSVFYTEEQLLILINKYNQHII